MYAENAAAQPWAGPPRTPKRLRLPRPEEPTADPDEAMIAGAMGRQRALARVHVTMPVPIRRLVAERR